MSGTPAARPERLYESLSHVVVALRGETGSLLDVRFVRVPSTKWNLDPKLKGLKSYCEESFGFTEHLLCSQTLRRGDCRIESLPSPSSSSVERSG